MDPVTVSINIDRPREEVFAYLVDIANHAEFLDHMFKDFHLVREDTYGKGAGFRYRSKAHMDRFGWGELNFLTIVPPRQLVAVGRSGKYNRTKTYCEWNLDANDARSTRVEFVFETEPPLATDKIMEALSGRRGWFKRNARKAVKRLRSILEEGESSRARGRRVTVAGL